MGEFAFLSIMVKSRSLDNKEPIINLINLWQTEDHSKFTKKDFIRFYDNKSAIEYVNKRENLGLDFPAFHKDVFSKIFPIELIALLNQELPKELRAYLANTLLNAHRDNPRPTKPEPVAPPIVQPIKAESTYKKHLLLATVSFGCTMFALTKASQTCNLPTPAKIAISLTAAAISYYSTKHIEKTITSNHL